MDNFLDQWNQIVNCPGNIENFQKYSSNNLLLAKSSQVKSISFNLHRIFCTLSQNEFTILLNKNKIEEKGKVSLIIIMSLECRVWDT